MSRSKIPSYKYITTLYSHEYNNRTKNWSADDDDFEYNITIQLVRVRNSAADLA